MMASRFGHMVLSHDGETHQYGAALRWVPEERIGVIAMTNTGRASVVSALAGEIAALISKRLGGSNAPKKNILRR